MRIIRNIITCGNADGSLSERALHARLDDALRLLEQSQKNPGDHGAQDERVLLTIEVIQDIVAGLLGCEVHFGNRDTRLDTQAPGIDVIRAYMDARERQRHGRGRNEQ